MLDEWEKRNRNIVDDQEKLMAELNKEEKWLEKWLSNVKKWEHENSEWQQGELARKREKIKKVISERKYDSAFVKEFLREKDMSGLSDRAVECALRQALVEIDLSQPSTLGSRYNEIQRHHKQQEHLKNEITELEKLLNDRLRAYERIEQGLKNIGVSSEKIEELNKQMKRLKHTADKSIEVKDRFDKVYQTGKNSLDDHTKQLNALIESFKDNINVMKRREPEFIAALYELIGIVGGAAAGAAGGGLAGRAILPGVGTIVGAVIGTAVGGVSGFIWGTVKGEEARSRVESQVRNYRQTLTSAQTKHDKLKDLLRD